MLFVMFLTTYFFYTGHNQTWAAGFYKIQGNLKQASSYNL